MKFLALDLETANSDYSSICQIGIAVFEDNKIIKTWSTLVNPEDQFYGINIAIHGIREIDVVNAPTLPQVYEQLKDLLQGNIVVHHMPFDKVALSRAFNKYNLSDVDILWLDSAKVARRTWEEFANRGYGLKNITQKLKINFKHHDALEDAIAAGCIVIKALEKLNISVEELVRRVTQPINKTSVGLIKLKGNPEGPLWGETIVFTGALALSRKEAAEIASKAGCMVIDCINETVSILVVGMQDTQKINGKGKSSKHIKTELLIAKGINIKIISEEDFRAMVCCTRV